MSTVERNELALSIKDSAKRAGLRPLPVNYETILVQLDRIERRLDAALGYR